MSDPRARHRRAPGWYRDPDDPTRLRHWSGRAWSLRRRAWPAWDIAVTDLVADPRLPGGPEAGADGQAPSDGPVRPAPLPAAAARRELGGGDTVAWLAQRAVPAARRPGAARGGGVSAPGALGDTPLGWTQSRRPMVVFASLVAVALALMAISVAISRPDTTTAAVASDAAFVDRANALCRATLAAAAGGAAMTPSPPTAADEATAVAHAADTVAGLVAQLSQVTTTPGASAAVGAWLATLRAYVDDSHHLSDGLSSATGDARLLRSRVDADVTQADSFAGLNGLGGCRLSTDTATAGNIVPVP